MAYTDSGDDNMAGQPSAAQPAPASSPPDNGGGGKHPAALDRHVAQVLWQRVAAMSPQDIQDIDAALPRHVGLLFLKLVPELSSLLLQAQQMQGPEMQPVRDSFNHDAIMQHVEGRMADRHRQTPVGKVLSRRAPTTGAPNNAPPRVTPPSPTPPPPGNPAAARPQNPAMNPRPLPMRSGLSNV